MSSPPDYAQSVHAVATIDGATGTLISSRGVSGVARIVAGQWEVTLEQPLSANELAVCVTGGGTITGVGLQWGVANPSDTVKQVRLSRIGEITAVDASDLPTAIALVNQIKTSLNAGLVFAFPAGTSDAVFSIVFFRTAV